jgi:hypothetical protein
MPCCTILGSVTTTCSPLLDCIKIVPAIITVKTASQKIMDNVQKYRERLENTRVDVQLLKKTRFNWMNHLRMQDEQGVLKPVFEGIDGRPLG